MPLLNQTIATAQAKQTQFTTDTPKINYLFRAYNLNARFYNPELVLDANLNQNLKTVYPTSTIVNSGQGNNPTNTGVTTAQIGSTGYYDYNFNGSDQFLDYTFKLPTAQFSFSTFFLTDTVSTQTGVVAEIKGETNNLTLVHVDTVLQLKLGSSVIFTFPHAVSTSAYGFVGLKLVNGWVSVFQGQGATGTLYTKAEPNFGQVGYIAIGDETFSSVRVGATLAGADHFDGEMNYITLNDIAIETTNFLNIYSSQQNFLSMATPIQITKVENALTQNIQRIGYVNPDFPDTRLNADPANTTYPVNIQEINSLWNIEAGNSLRNIELEYQTFLANGGYPSLYYNPLFVNRNVWVNANGSDDVSAGAYSITLVVGTYTVWFGEDTGTIVSTNGTGVASKQCNVTTAGAGNSDTIIVTTAGTFTFTVTGNPKYVQIEAGTTATIYQPRRDATAVRPFNLGERGALGDLTVNNNFSNMLALNGDRVFQFDGNNDFLSNTADTFMRSSTNYTIICKLVNISSAGSGQRVLFAQQATGNFHYLNIEGGLLKMRVGAANRSGSSVVNGDVIALTRSGNDFKTYINGVLDLDFTDATAATGGTGYFTIGALLNGTTVTFPINATLENILVYRDRALTVSEISNLTNDFF